MSQDEDKVSEEAQSLQQMKRINEIISNVLMTSNISQSIGRNQGFRANGFNTVAVLPIYNEFDNLFFI